MNWRLDALKGCVAHEVQIGPVVIQRFFAKRQQFGNRRWYVWLDRVPS